MVALNRSSRARVALTACLTAVMALFLLAGQATAATQSAFVTFQDPGVSPGSGLGFGLYNFEVAHEGAEDHPFAPGVKRGHCVEATVDGADGVTTLKTGDDVAVNPTPPTTDQANRVAWLLLSTLYRQDNPGPTLALDQIADAHQSAIWQYTDPTETEVIFSEDEAVAAEATTLVANAELHKSAAQQKASIAATGVATCGPGTRGVEVKGAPFSTAQLTVTSGGGLFPGGVTGVSLDLGPTGTASTTIASGVGTVAISATVQEATLVDADFEETQDLVYTESTPVTVTLSIEFPACTVPAAPTQPTALIPVSATPRAKPRPAIPARLRITKRGPKRARAGKRIKYTIIVRNTSRVRARNLVIRDRLPAGMVLTRRNRGVRQNGRNLIIRVGSLAGRRSVRRVVTVQLLRTTKGRRCNVATANASNAKRVRARSCTRVSRVVQKVLPAVTG